MDLIFMFAFLPGRHLHGESVNGGATIQETVWRELCLFLVSLPCANMESRTLDNTAARKQRRLISLDFWTCDLFNSCHCWHEFQKFCDGSAWRVWNQSKCGHNILFSGLGTSRFIPPLCPILCSQSALDFSSPTVVRDKYFKSGENVNSPFHARE